VIFGHKRRDSLQHVVKRLRRREACNFNIVDAFLAFDR